MPRIAHVVRLALPWALPLAALVVLAAGLVVDVGVAARALAVATLAAAWARTVLAVRENAALLRHSRAEAQTDSLTGLGNRRALAEDLEVVLTQATPARPATLALFDLEGYKAYIDAFGHVAGDVVLARLGRALTVALGATGRGYRVGGDEFCVVVRGDRAPGAGVLAAAADALAARGEGFAISASCGAVCVPLEAAEAGAALLLADERRYAYKDVRRASTRQRVRELLLHVLAEREPELREHMRDVAGLAHDVGRRMGLGASALDEVARGAELHDVGKVAVPDEVLSKPGALDDLEWDLMRHHVVAGERILAAAPALRPVARIVRASHERWDGQGYPDRLAGEEIPLGARIVAVCDAFDAMTTERSYQPARTFEQAMGELRRCAGTQFDPAVVEAFCAVLAERMAASSGQ